MANHLDRSPEAPSRGSTRAEYIAQALTTEGGHLSIECHGFALYFGRDIRLHGYDCDTIKAECLAAGLPVIDSREAPFDKLIGVVLRGPMVAVGRAADPEPYHALAYAPLAYVAEAYRSIGAEVRNLPSRL